MEEPYHSIQNIGEATEQLAANTDAPANEQFSEAQLLLNQLFQIKSGTDALSVDWQQYIAGVEITLQRIQAETRSRLNRHDAAQIFIKTQADLGRGKVELEESERSARYQSKEKIKLRTLTAAAVAFILLIITAIGIYQWTVFSSDEGWFHDISLKRWAVIEKRMSFGKSIETKDHNGLTGFLYLARTGSLADLKQMQKLGADIHATDNAGRGALHYAAAATNPDAVEWLISEGIDPNVEDHTGTTPLHYFFMKAPGTQIGINTYQLLLSKGARTDTANDEESLFMAAVLWVRGSFDQKPAVILNELISKGADVNYQGINGSTALKNALARYLPKTPKPASLLASDPVVKLLVDSGATFEDESLTLSDDLDETDAARIDFIQGL